MADASGTTVWRWDQAEPFGSNPADEDPDANSVAFDLPLRLPGQRYDAETALHYNYFRDYDPGIGRYGKSDPIGLHGGINTYAYVLGSPIDSIDRLGLQSPAMCLNPANAAVCAEAGIGLPSAATSAAAATGAAAVSGSTATEKSPQEVVDEAPVPAWPGLTNLKDCRAGDTHVEPATDKRWKNGGVSIDQEYHCGCGCIVRHSIVFNGVVVHDHFYPCPIKRGQPR